MKFLFIACTLFSLSAQAGLDDAKLWGPLPQNYKRAYVGGAKKLKAAIVEKNSAALLTIGGEWRDYGLYEHARLEFAAGHYRTAVHTLQTIISEFPQSPVNDRAVELLPQAEIALAKSLAEKSKGESLQLFARGFGRLPWKRWIEYEDALRVYLELYSKKDAVLVGAFLAELLNALPMDSALRKEIVQRHSNLDPSKLQKLPKTRSLLGTSSIKAIFPDQALIDEGMALVLAEKWSEALEKFRQFSKDFLDSEQIDRALYWEARCLKQLGKTQEAKEKFAALLERFPLSYYGLQAALNLETPLPSLLSSTPPLELKEIEGILLPRQWYSLWRLRALVEADAPALAREEAEYLFNQRPAGTTLGQESAASSLALAKLYFASTYYLGAFTQFFSAYLADKSVLHANNLPFLFPAVFEKEIAAAAAESDLDPNVILSLTKQESAFIPDALSRSDAMGLMQIIMPTAKEIDPKLTRDTLNDPATNVRAGASYLRKLLDKYNGNLALALAAYNAGPNRASQWQRKLLESPMMNKEFQVDVFIDTIPFTETRRYVGSILRNLAWYRVLQKQEIPRSVQELSTQWRKPSSKP